MLDTYTGADVHTYLHTHRNYAGHVPAGTCDSEMLLSLMTARMICVYDMCVHTWVPTLTHVHMCMYANKCLTHVCIETQAENDFIESCHFFGDSTNSGKHVLLTHEHTDGFTYIYIYIYIYIYYGDRRVDTCTYNYEQIKSIFC